MYAISNRTKKIASALGYKVYPSNVGYHKIAVYRNGYKIADVGDIRYMDYHQYRKINLELAEKKRQNYRARHKKNINRGRGRLAWLLLWN